MDENLVIYKRKECPRDKMPVLHEKLGSRTCTFVRSARNYMSKCLKLFLARYNEANNDHCITDR
jgi:hypothetical protein